MAVKSFDGQNELSSQGETWEELEPSDSVDFPFVPKAIQVTSATGGAFYPVGSDNVAARIYGTPGSYHPIRPKRINLTGMTPGMTFTGLKT